MVPVTHVIFDLDGLLINSDLLYEDVYRKVCLNHGKYFSWDLKKKVCGRPSTDVQPIIVESLGLPISLEQFKQEVEAELACVLPNTQLMPGAERLLMHLHENNIPMAIATSSAQKQFKIKTENLKFYHYFNHILTGPNEPKVKKGKPAPDIFLICREKFPTKQDGSMDPLNKFLVFEDSVAGVVGAAAAGMQVVMVPDPRVDIALERLDPAFKPTVVVKSLLDFKPEIFGLPPFPEE